MNIFKTILGAIDIIGILKKKPTPETGKKLEAAASNLFGIGASINAATGGAIVTYPKEVIDYILKAWEVSPVLGGFIIISLTAINVAPHIGAFALKLAGQSQIEGNPDKELAA